MLSTRARVAIWAIAALLASVVCAAAGALVWRAHGEVMRLTLATTQQFAGGAEAALNRTLIGVDSLLADLPTLIQPAIGDDSRIDGPRAQRKISAVIGQNLLLREVVLVDAQGRVMVGGSPSVAAAGLRLPEGYLQEVLEARPAALRISVPTLDFATSERLVYLGRRVSMKDRPDVVALAAIPLPLLATVLSPGGEVPGLVITLERRDGLLFASVPAIDARIGSTLEMPLDDAAYRGVVADGRARLDGVPAVVAARVLTHPDLRVVVAAPLSVALADWRGLRTLAAVVSACFAMLLVASAAVLQRQVSRLADARIETVHAKGTLERALDSMGDGFVLWDRDERLVAWNERYLELFPWLRGVVRVGVSFEEVIGIAALHIVGDHRSVEERDAWRATRLAEHRSGAGMYDRELHNGIVVHVVKRRTPDGGVVVIVRDVTRAERELAQAKARAEAANEAKSRFLATMSHEMRTPLSGVLGINALLSATPLDDQQKSYVGTIDNCSHALLALIDDVLDLSRIEAGRLEFVAAPFDPVRLCEEAVESLRARAVEKSIRLVFEAQREVPRSLVGDANRLRQVLFNLIGNALKFTERGTVDLSLSTHPMDDGRVELAVKVRDTGIGISDEVLPRLFERFTQADQTTARRFGGTGLGLAISREILHAMGGGIEVDSQLGVGSEFRVRVPLAQGPRLVASATPLATDGTTTQPLRILVAEDNEVNQLVIGAMLDQLGHGFEIVCDGHSAVERAREGSWDCVLMDIQMPGMDGLAATQRIRAFEGPEGRVPIVALTANAMTHDRALHLEAGMNEHLSKPLQPQQLAAVLARLCSTS